MNENTKSSIQKAVILFSDIIDCSVYSSILGIEQYAKDLLKFQKHFEQLAEKYFGEDVLKNARVFFSARGDEGTVFCIAPHIKPGDLIYRAIKFAFELKAIMELIMKPREEGDKVPRKMKVGIGIHFGEVATVLSSGKVEVATKMSDIAHIEGFSINYAKRVESSSRSGKFSKIFLSKAASSYIWDYPVVLEKHQSDLKGVSKVDDVFEIRSAYLRDMSLDYPPEIFDDFFANYVVDYLKLDFIHEPWLKSFVMSVLDSLNDREKYSHIAKKYLDRQLKLAWHNHSEDDPILLFMRAVDCKNEGKHTRRLSILRDIIHKFPFFLYAQKELIKAVSDLINEPSQPSELVYARDIAQEFLDKFKNCLKDDDEVKEFKSIIEKINPKLRSY